MNSMFFLQLSSLTYSILQVEMVEEFEPGKASYNDMLLKVKDCQARVYFLYAR